MGLFIFSIGLFKKVVIADTFAVWATQGFDVASTLNLFEAWATSLSYTFQLYFDFSGYTDMAIGLALLFNIRLPINFNSPYKATNIQDFWRRWHITLSRFLRDYVYIPLGGNKKGDCRTYTNLMATFLLGGLWHGAGWTFVFWGFLHGLAVMVQRLWSKVGVKLWTWLAWLITFNFVNIAWVFFRAKEWESAIKVLSGMFSLKNLDLNFNYLQILSILLGFAILLLFKNTMNIFRSNFKFNLVEMLLFINSMIVSILVISLGGSSEFLYFNF
jgi:D-alanyl-lipoteichoic acid acyltransferase DltB (MBOAT superfamily)